MIKNAAPLVSVVIPSYNHARYLGRALQSLIDQTYTNWNAIIVDNHSTDNTDEVVASFSDFRISYFKIHNGGVIGASRNVGICASRGEWIAFLDSDDWWKPEKLLTCIMQIHDKVDFIYHDVKIMRSSSSLLKRRNLKSRKLRKPILIDLLNNGNIICNSSVMVRKSILNRVGGVSEKIDMISSEDYNTWLKVSEITDGFVHIPKYLGYYTVHQNNISKKNNYLSWKSSVEQFKHMLSLEQLNRLDSKCSYLNARFKYAKGHYFDASSEIINCLRYADLNIRIRATITLIIIIIKIKFSRKLN